MLYINTFGRFELRNDNLEKPIRFSSKANCLLAYLIVHRAEICNRERIMEELWGENAFKNPVNALKTSISRLRSALNELLGEDEYILQIGNGYQWNPNIEICVDTEMLMKYYQAANDITRPIEERILDYKHAIDSYKGRFLIESSGYLWVDNLNRYYQAIDSDCKFQLILLYNQNEEFQKLEDLCRISLNTDSLNESIHYYYILSKIKLNKYDEALEAYNHAEMWFQKELGITKLEKLATLWDDIFLKTGYHDEVTFHEVEKTIPPESTRGAYLCCYSFFKEIIRLESRRMKRERHNRSKRYIPRYLAILNVNSINDQPTIDYQQNLVYFQTIEKSILTYIRAGDVVAHCNYNQYIMLIYGGSVKDCEKMLLRVKTTIIQNTSQTDIEIYYKELLKQKINKI